MAAPNLTIQVEPVEASALVYASLAAKSKGDPPEGQLLLVLKITNHEPDPIYVTEVTISLVGPPNIAPVVMKLPPPPMPPPTPPPTPPLPLIINAGGTGEWTLVEYWNPNILLPVPAPASIKVSLTCVSLGSPATVFSGPAVVSMPLAPYSSPAAGGGYAFPFKTTDLLTGEFLTGLTSGEDYHRARAYDLSIHKYQSLTKEWLPFPAGADATKNESYYVWDKPVYAIADGTVEQVLNTTTDNTTAGEIPASPPPPNHVYIRHGAELVWYAHFRKGTIDPAIVAGAAVVTGQFLGRVGNTGRSGGPHLHISLCRSLTIPPPEEPLRPLPFSGIWVLELLTGVDPNVWPPDNATPWSHVTAQCLPSVTSAIWPGYLKLSKKAVFNKLIARLIWPWMVFVGTLMVIPGIGPECLACGPVMRPVLGLVSIALGVAGLVLSAITRSSETAPMSVAALERLGKEHRLD